MHELPAQLLLQLEAQVRGRDFDACERIDASIQHAVSIAQLEQLERKDVEGALDAPRLEQQRSRDAQPAPARDARARAA